MKGFLYGQTEYNIGSSTARMTDYIKMAKKNQFDYLTITDSNMHACYKFYTECMHEGIKPVIGLEYTVTDADMSSSRVLLYAMNNTGYKSLLKITSKVKLDKESSLSFIKGEPSLYFIFVYKDSYLERLFLSKAYDVLNEYLEEIRSMKGYIGISFLNHPEMTPELNALKEYLNEKKIPYVTIHQMKYLLPEDSIVYEALTEINGHPEKIGGFDDYSFWENPVSEKITDTIIESIHYDLFKAKPSLPKFPDTRGRSSSEFLYALCHKGLEKRGKYYKNYLDRLQYELSIIHRMGYDDYFLIVWDFVKFSKQNGILVGPGRGSAAGSLVAYCLGITEIDPLEYDLLFERFLNPERVSMPDIDTDFPVSGRDAVISHVREVYGDMHVCNIVAFGTFQLKSSVRELSKVFHIEESRMLKIIDMVEAQGYDKLLEQYKGDELYSFLYCARGLENLPKHLGTHAAGIVLSSEELPDVIPLGEGINDLHQSQYEAVDLEKIGLLKMDFLVVGNLDLIEGMMHDVAGFTLEKLRNIPLNDPKVYKLLQNADTLGIFQMERPGFRSMLRSMQPTEFKDIVAALALYRPGPMENIPEFCACKHGKKIIYPHKDLEPILRETYGIIVYQEQIMKIAQVFAGYSLGEADLLRRAVSKKDASKLEAQRSDFISRSIQKGYPKETAENIYNLIFKFADYGFNKSHSVAYSVFAYQMLYFKANYFNAFMSNIMNNVISDTKTMVSYIAYAKARGLYAVKPNINISTDRFVFIKNWLYMPFNAIFSIGDSVSKQITEERSRGGQFKNFEDFKERCSFLSQSNIQALVYAGALDVFGKSKKSMLEASDKQTEIFLKFIGNERVDNDSEYDFATLREMEKKYIGMNLEYSLFKNSEPLYQKNNASRLSSIKLGFRGSVIAAFTDFKEIKTKKGDFMMLGTLEDEAKSLHFTIFPRTYAAVDKDILNTNSLYLLNGVFDKDNRGEECFTVNHIVKLN